MCLAWTSRKSDWKERTSERRDFKSFFSLLPLGTRTELLGRSFPEGLTNEILFRTKNLTNFAEKNAYFKKSEKTILTENQCYMKIVPYCRKIFHEVSLPVGWIWPGSGTFNRVELLLTGFPVKNKVQSCMIFQVKTWKITGPYRYRLVFWKKYGQIYVQFASFSCQILC